MRHIPDDDDPPLPESYPVREPDLPRTKSETFWVVEGEWEDGTSILLRDAFAKAREELGFDRDEDIYFQSSSSAVAHARRILVHYSAQAGGTVTSEIQRQLREDLGCSENEPLALEWRVVGEPKYMKITFIPGFVRISQNYEVRATGFREESIVVDGKTYTRKVEAQTEWWPAKSHTFRLGVSDRRISLGD
jgi:hypothetical protein